jgi:hypothetical protein
MIHPADFARMSPEDRMIASYRGDIDSGIHWKVVRVAEFTGLDPDRLEHRRLSPPPASRGATLTP